MSTNENKPAEEAKAKAKAIVYDGPIPDMAGPVTKILMEFFENPLSMKDGKPWLTSEDVKAISERMQDLIKDEAESIYSGFHERVEEEVEEEVERKEYRRDKMDIGLTFKDAELLVEYLQGYRKLLEKEKESSEQLVIELRQFEFRFSDRIQSKKYW